MDYGRFHDERCWHFHFWCCLCTLLVRTVDRFLTTVSFSLIMQVGDGFWMKSYIFLFFSAFHGNERYRIGKKMLMLGFQENEIFFHVASRNYLFIYTVSASLKVLIYGWNWWLWGGGSKSFAGFAREIVYLIGQTNSRLSGKVTEIKKPITVATTMVGVVFVWTRIPFCFFP